MLNRIAAPARASFGPDLALRLWLRCVWPLATSGALALARSAASAESDADDSFKATSAQQSKTRRSFCRHGAASAAARRPVSVLRGSARRGCVGEHPFKEHAVEPLPWAVKGQRLSAGGVEDGEVGTDAGEEGCKVSRMQRRHRGGPAPPWTRAKSHRQPLPRRRQPGHDQALAKHHERHGAGRGPCRLTKRAAQRATAAPWRRAGVERRQRLVAAEPSAVSMQEHRAIWELL